SLSFSYISSRVACAAVTRVRICGSVDPGGRSASTGKIDRPRFCGHRNATPAWLSPGFGGSPDTHIELRTFVDAPCLARCEAGGRITLSQGDSIVGVRAASPGAHELGDIKGERLAVRSDENGCDGLGVVSCAEALPRRRAFVPRRSDSVSSDFRG